MIGGSKMKIIAGEWLKLSLFQKQDLLKNHIKKEQ
jgi:hypothetical protein